MSSCIFTGRVIPRTNRTEFLRKAVEAVRPLPGINVVGVANILPLGGEGNNNLLFLDGVNLPMFERPLVDMRSVNGDYFRAMGIPLRTGRVFEESDRKHGVAMVGESTARKIWPGESPMGKRFHFGEDNAPTLEVIGVVGDVRGNGLEKAPQQVVYLPYWYRGRNANSMVIRTAMDPKAIAGAVRAELRKLDPELPVPQFKTLADIVSAVGIGEEISIVAGARVCRDRFGARLFRDFRRGLLYGRSEAGRDGNSTGARCYVC